MAVLRDFQIYAGPGNPDVNDRLFTCFEPIRLWLRDHHVRAPFRKILIELMDDPRVQSCAPTVGVAIGICHVVRVLPPGHIAASTTDHRWTLDLVRSCLQDIKESLGWHDDGLDAAVLALRGQPLPLSHTLARLTRTDRSSGIRCEIVFVTTFGESRAIARLTRPEGAISEVVVGTSVGAVDTEDYLPAKTIIRDGFFVLLDASKKELARVAIAPNESAALQ